MKTNLEMYELNMEDLDQASGGAAVPGGSVTKFPDGSTFMIFSNGAAIAIGANGSISTVTSGGARGGAHPA